MFKQLMQLAVVFGLCASCAPALAADNLPFSPSSASGQNSALCPPGQVAAHPSGQLWVNQADLHRAWECFVPRQHAFAARPSQGPDPAQRSTLPSLAAARAPSSPSSRPAAIPAPSQPAQVQVKLDLGVDVDLQVSANGEPVAASSGQVSLPPVSVNLSGTSVQTSPASAIPDSPATSPATAVPAPIVPVLPTQPLNSEPAQPETAAPAANIPASAAPSPSAETDALFNARPVLPSQGGSADRSLVSPKV